MRRERPPGNRSAVRPPDPSAEVTPSKSFTRSALTAIKPTVPPNRLRLRAQHDRRVQQPRRFLMLPSRIAYTIICGWRGIPVVF